MGALSARPRLSPCRPHTGLGARAAASTSGRTLGWGVRAQGHVLSSGGPAACSSLSHVPCHLMPPAARSDAPSSCSSCLNGVRRVRACGSGSTGPAAWTLSRLGRAHNLSGSQTVFQGALGAGKACRRGADGCGRTGCLQLHRGSLSRSGAGRGGGPALWPLGARAPCSAGRSSAPRPAPCRLPWPPGSGNLALRSGKQTLSGGGWAVLRSVLTRHFSSQGDQDDRSSRQCRTSSPSSAGSVSLGRYTPTSRSPQHYSRPGTWPHGSFDPSGSRVSCCFSSYKSVSYVHRAVWAAGGRWRTRPSGGGPSCPGGRGGGREAAGPPAGRGAVHEAHRHS